MCSYPAPVVAQSPVRSQVSRSALLFIFVIAVTFGCALFLLRSRFMWYDDEGFMLMTLREYLEGRPLYTGIYTEYGPFYYVVIGGLLSVARWPVSHDVGRWLTLGCWLATAGAWAWCV